MIPVLNRRGLGMTRFVEGADRGQSTLLPECLDDWVADDNPVRVIDAFVAALDLAELGFGGVEPAGTGRPSYHPAALLKLYIYGYLNRVHSSRRLEREAGRNVEVMWLLARLAPDHKTIADFRKDNGPGIKKVCARFIEVCRKMGLLATASVAIDGSKFKAVNNRDKNFTRGKVERRRTQLEESPQRPYQAMGARGRSRTRSGAARQESKSHAHTPRDRRASVRHTEDAHGRDALLVRDAAESCDRDGAVRARLQSDTRAEHRRDETAAGGGEGVIRALARAVAVHRARERAPTLRQGEF